MKSLMHRNLVGLMPLLLATSMTLQAAPVAANSAYFQAQARTCLNNQFSAGELHEMGRAYAKTPLSWQLPSKAQACVSSGQSAGENAGSSAAFSVPEFRAGVYHQVLTTALPVAKVQVDAFSSLTRELESFVDAREGALNCLGAPQGLLSMMQEMDLPFTTAALGLQLSGLSPEQAQTGAQVLVSQVRDSRSHYVAQSCEGPVESKFRQYSERLAKLFTGAHPLAPGCKVLMDNAGTQLTCEAANVMAP